jgi:hypothetical protein
VLLIPGARTQQDWARNSENRTNTIFLDRGTLQQFFFGPTRVRDAAPESR